ncbi:MAG TPA: carboxypeptidase-like regulatory domain-containing protein [bacterium]|nr:carboxypeptidase-like regulatory domain-containing protein [bacterium]
MSTLGPRVMVALIVAAVLVVSCEDHTKCLTQPSPPYSVSGHVRDGEGKGIDGVRINQGCDIAGGADTDTSGYWIISNISADSCTFTPEKEGCTFSPGSWTVSGNAQNVNFTGSCGPPYSVSGYVRDAENHGIAGVHVTKGCDVGGWHETDANGYWEIRNISDAECVFTPEKVGCTFTPTYRTIAGNARNVNFTGSCAGQ